MFFWNAAGLVVFGMDMGSHLLKKMDVIASFQPL